MDREQVNALREQMSALADLAHRADAKSNFMTDAEEKVKVIHDYAAKIALAALKLCPPDRLADVSAVFKEHLRADDERELKELEMIGPKLAAVFLQCPLSLPGGLDGVEVVRPACDALPKKRRLTSVSSITFVAVKSQAGGRIVTAEADFAVNTDTPRFMGEVFERRHDSTEEQHVCSVDFDPSFGSVRVAKILRGIVHDICRYYAHKNNYKQRSKAKREAANA